jgi:dUTP pyrophosphatase
MIVKIKFLDENAKIPKRALDGDACYDVIATSKEDIGFGRIRYGFGFALEIPPNTQADFRPRSSIYKTGLILSNCIGTIDEGYRGEIGAVFYHMIPELPPYDVGDRILQMQIRSREDVTFEVVDVLSSSERGVGGYGSTGLK